MVNFEDGQLVKGAYVLINGVEYPVIMPQYSGDTPITSENLNKIQRDLTDVINGVQENVNTLETKVNGIFKFKKYEKEITINGTSSKAVTMGSFSDVEGYAYLGCVANENGYGDQFLVTYSKYGENITAMVHNQFASNLTKTLKCIVIFVKEDYYNTNLMSEV